MALSSPAAPSTIRNSGRCKPRLVRSSSTLRQASALSPPMFLIASRTFCPSARTPSTTSSEIEVALRSSRTRTTVPSRISLTIGSSASERVFQASQSVFTLRQVRLRVLAHRAAKQRRQRPANPPRVGAGQIGGGDHRIRRDGAALIGLQCLALPFGRTAVGGVQSGARHGYLDRAKRSKQRARPVAMTMAGYSPLCHAGFLARVRRNTPIAGSGKHRIELLLHHRLDEIAHPAAHSKFNRVKPIVEKLGGCLRYMCRGIRLRGMLLHGVVSSPAR